MLLSRQYAVLHTLLIAVPLTAAVVLAGCDAEVSSTPEDEGPNISLSVLDADDPGRPTLTVGTSVLLDITATDDVAVRDALVELVRGEAILVSVPVPTEDSSSLSVQVQFDIPAALPPSGDTDAPYIFRASAGDEAGNRDTSRVEVILLEAN